MEASYELTLDDLRAYLDWGARQPTTKRLLDRTRYLGGGVFFAVAALFALAGSISADGALTTMAVFLALAGVVMLVVLGPRMRTSYVKRSLAALAGGKTAYLLGPRTARVSAEGFGLSGPGLASSYAWPLVDRVESSASGVYVFLGAAQAHVVPRSAFASHDELVRFAQTAEDFRRAAEGPAA